MTSPEKLRAEIEKGCGIYFVGNVKGNEFGQTCGSKSEVRKDYIYLCPTCKAKLSIIKLWEDNLQQEQARVIKLIDENLKNSPLLEIERRLLEELKSKIIGKSQVQDKLEVKKE
jgi:hypothetical protein